MNENSGDRELRWHYCDGSLYIEGEGCLYDSTQNWPEHRDHISHVVIASGCTAISNGVFSDHKALETVTLPDTLCHIGERAFSGCSSLREISIPEGVTQIAWATFKGCTGLTRMTLPDGIT